MNMDASDPKGVNSIIFNMKLTHLCSEASIFYKFNNSTISKYKKY